MRCGTVQILGLGGYHPEARVLRRWRCGSLSCIGVWYVMPLLTLVCCLCEVVVMVAACGMLLLVPVVRMSCEAVPLELIIFGWQLSVLNNFGGRLQVGCESMRRSGMCVQSPVLAAQPAPELEL
jgi:hypothetical protein